jgi:hypothetical protein
MNHQLTPLRSEGRGANSFLVTTWPLFKPTKRPVLGCFGAITCLQNHYSVNLHLDKRISIINNRISPSLGRIFDTHFYGLTYYPVCRFRHLQHMVRIKSN